MFMDFEVLGLTLLISWSKVFTLHCFNSQDVTVYWYFNGHYNYVTPNNLGCLNNKLGGRLSKKFDILM